MDADFLSKFYCNFHNAYENHLILRENNDKNNENFNHNIINNKPNYRRRSSFLKSPKKEFFETSEKKILGDINSLIKSRFGNSKIEENRVQSSILYMMIPANVNDFILFFI